MLIGLAAAWLVVAAVGFVLGGLIGREWAGLALAVVLGPVGLILLLFVPPTVRAEAERRFLVEQELERLRGAADEESLAG